MLKGLSKLAGNSAFNETILTAPLQPVCATEARFCLPNPITLTLREKFFLFSKDDFQISCAATGTSYFQCEGSVFSLREKKVIRDSYGAPVANFKEQLFSFRDRFNVFAGDSSDKQLCSCVASINFIRAKLTTDFTDATSGLQRRVVLKGDWRDKRCIIYLGDPRQGGIPIAKIFRPFSLRSHFLESDTYHLEIAAGIDIALMVILCIALDEHARD